MVPKTQTIVPLFYYICSSIVRCMCSTILCCYIQWIFTHSPRVQGCLRVGFYRVLLYWRIIRIFIVCEFERCVPSLCRWSVLRNSAPSVGFFCVCVCMFVVTCCLHTVLLLHEWRRHFLEGILHFRHTERHTSELPSMVFLYFSCAVFWNPLYGSLRHPIETTNDVLVVVFLLRHRVSRSGGWHTWFFFSFFCQIQTFSPLLLYNSRPPVFCFWIPPKTSKSEVPVFCVSCFHTFLPLCNTQVLPPTLLAVQLQLVCLNIVHAI